MRTWKTALKHMRKITEKIANAFLLSNDKSMGNTWTNGKSVYLHGNKIAEKREDGIYLSLAGWNTPTTRERLNGILRVFNIEGGFTQKKFEPYFNGKRIDAGEWLLVHTYPFAK